MRGSNDAPKIAPYGSWKSPITAELIVAGTIGLSQPRADGPDLYWVEARPGEGGRQVIVRRTPDGRTADVTPPPYNARTRVHEYGGGDYAVVDGAITFQNFTDQHLCRVEPGGEPRPIYLLAGHRHADFEPDRRRGRLICVREDHTAGGPHPENLLAAVALDGGSSQVLASGRDFYASPRLSPDGSRLAWLQWDQPNMPWDGCELWLAEVRDDGSLGAARRVAGGKEESIFQPAWSPDGGLYFVSDRTGWWNLYRWEGGEGGETLPLAPREAEFGLPQWQFGYSTYAFASRDRIVCTYAQAGMWHLAVADVPARALRRLDTPFNDIGFVQAGPGFAVFVAASATEPPALVRYDLATGRHEVLRRSTAVTVDPGYVSVPEAIEFPTSGGRTAHAFFYPPKNRDFAAPPGERPPLLVLSHGGPTGAASPRFNLAVQFWTSRGFAVVDVNYGGSTGYGRAYRERLNGRWGVVDLDDCTNAALYLAGRGLVDRGRLAIRGGSAGGYTTLAALTFRDVFRAGASYFGVSDLEALARETHKFEARYLDGIIGPYPERQDLYRARSPIHFPERLSCPVIFFQGLDDKVVPPNQAERMVEALRKKGVPVAYLAFEGEGHGFRRAGTIKRALEAELYFYGRVLGFEPADPVEPVAIENL